MSKEVINPCMYKGLHKRHVWTRGSYTYTCRGLDELDIESMRAGR